MADRSRGTWLALSLAIVAGCGEGASPPEPGLAARIVRVEVTAPETAGLAGWTIPLTAMAYDSADAVVPEAHFTWRSDAPARATVDTAGVVTIGTEYGGTLIIATEDSRGLADSVYVRLASEGQVRWAVKTAYPPHTFGGPTVARDGSIWQLTDARTLTDGDQAVLVHLSSAGGVLCDVLLAGVSLNLVIVPPEGNDVWVTGSTVYQVTPECGVRQSRVFYPSSIFKAGAVAPDGTVLAPVADSLVALTPALTSLWARPRLATGHGWLGPVTVTGARVYAKAVGDTMFAFDLATGATIWSQPEADSAVDLRQWGHGPAVVPGRVYVPARFSFVAYDTNGTRLWKSPRGGTGVSEPVVTADGRIFVQLQTEMVAWDADGNVLWRSPYGRPRWAGWMGGPALAETGLIYIAGDQGFYAVDLDGNLVWSTTAATGDSTWFAGAPAIAPDGMIYTTGGTHVYAIFGTHPPDPTSPWPMFRHDAQRSGSVR